MLERRLLVNYMNISEPRVEGRLIGLVEENRDIDFDTLRQYFIDDAKHKRAQRKVEYTDGELKEIEEIAENKADEALHAMHRAKTALSWLFKNKSPFAITYSELRALEKKDSQRYKDVVALHEAAIGTKADLQRVSAGGVVKVESMERLLYISNDMDTTKIPDRILTKYPCASVFSFKIAHFIWGELKRPPPVWEDLKKVAFMVVICKRTCEDGQLNFDVMQQDKGEYILARSIVSELWQNASGGAIKKFDDMDFNKLKRSNQSHKRPRWEKAIADMQTWLLNMVNETSGKALASMPVPLCVDKGQKVIYTKMWYPMWNTMIEDIEYYMLPRPREEEARKGFDAKFCPVCLADFKGVGHDGPELRFTQCNHAICKPCFDRCEKVAGGNGGSKASSKDREEYHRCPICRAETYLKTLRDSDRFLTWYEDEKDAKRVPEFSEYQLAPILSLLNTHRGCVNVDGAGGTGKSELASLLSKWDLYCRGTYGVSDSIVARAVFIAPTGTAAKNMERRLPRNEFQVGTIHSWALSLFRGQETVVAHDNSEFALPFLFIDEAAMVSTWIMSCVLRLTRMMGIERIVLLGDRYQLPPVKAIGSLFASFCLSKSSCISDRVFRLKHCYRTGVKGITTLLQRLREVMEHLEEKGGWKAAKEMGAKLLVEEDFTCRDDENHSIDLIKVPGNAANKQHVLLNEVQGMLKQFAEEKTDSGDSSPLCNTTCVITDKRKKSALLELQFLPKPTIEQCAADYNSMLESMNPVRKRMREKEEMENTKNKRVRVDRFVAGDAVMSTVNVSVDSKNHKPKKLVLSNGSQGKVVSIRYGTGLKGARGYLKDVEEMDVIFDDQHFKYPVSEWYPISPFVIDTPTPNDIVAQINHRNQEALSNMFKGLVIGSVQTVHKYQGSQQENVVVAMSGGGKRYNREDNFHTLNLLYTAVSRAQKRIRLILDDVTLKHFIETPTLAPQDQVLIERLNKMK